MSPLERAGYLAHARSSGFLRRVETAKACLHRGLESCPSAYVSHSLGKDSAALAHLVWAEAPSTPMRFLRWEGETEHLDNYDEVLRLWQSVFGIVIEQVCLSRASLSTADLERWDALRSSASGAFLGLREEESHGRKMTLRHHGAIYESRQGIWRICPLAKWTSLDVGAYITLHNIPLLRSYSLEGMEHRTSARIPRAAHRIREKALERIRAHNPTGYNELLTRFPELEGLL